MVMVQTILLVLSAGTTSSGQLCNNWTNRCFDYPEYYLRIGQSRHSDRRAVRAQFFRTDRSNDVRTFAGQTITVSFYAKADSRKQWK